MGKLTIDDLKQIRDTTARKIAQREGKARIVITVHMGDCGLAAGGREIMNTLLEERVLADRPDIMIIAADGAETGDQAPMISVDIASEKKTVQYGRLTPETAALIFRQHVLGGTVQTDLQLTGE